MKDLGYCLAERRRRLDMTQADLAEKMGVTQQTISNMEKNPGRITMQDMYELNKILDLESFQLLKAFGKTTKEILEFAREYR